MASPTTESDEKDSGYDVDVMPTKNVNARSKKEVWMMRAAVALIVTGVWVTMKCCLGGKM
ncbi:hypothetical protein M422DRAFT_777731 [Sphaerobolus stellatus SS14]|nr:hypothetical protein M422DRAFT_777731 [Sphaerobolus stellatus SS14]